jgi:hypothetical protein
LPQLKQKPVFSIEPLREPLYATYLTRLNVRVSGVPDGSLVRVRPNPRRHSADTGLTMATASGGTSLRTAVGGAVVDSWVFTVENRAVTDRGLVLDVEIEVQTPGEAEPSITYVRSAPIPMTRMKRVTEENTARLAAAFSLVQSPGVYIPGVPPGRWTEACEGAVGGHRVGMIQRRGKLAFRAHTGLKGAHCTWQGKAAAPHPVRVVAMTWRAESQGRCEKPRGDASLPRVNCSELGLLRSDWASVGDRRQVMAALARCHPSTQTPRMRLDLKCPGWPTSDDYVESILESVELEIPEDWDLDRFRWSLAPFNPD